jgi:hypothetical protein
MIEKLERVVKADEAGRVGAVYDSSVFTELLLFVSV